MTNNRPLRRKIYPTPDAPKSLDAPAMLGRVAHGTSAAAYPSKNFSGIRTPSLPLAARISAYIGCRIDRLYVALRSITKRKARS
jgi:hypothetical protein